jgi:hypothetical protein
MSAIEYKTEQKIQKIGIDILYKGLGVTDFIRFMQQFNQGYGNYVEDRQLECASIIKRYYFFQECL